MSLGVHPQERRTDYFPLRPGERPVHCMVSRAEQGRCAYWTTRARLTETMRPRGCGRHHQRRDSQGEPKTLQNDDAPQTVRFPSFSLFLSRHSARDRTPRQCPMGRLLTTHRFYNIAFGIRNVTSTPDVLREAQCVLKPGSTFTYFEFNKVTNPRAQYVPLQSNPRSSRCQATACRTNTSLNPCGASRARATSLIGGNLEGDSDGGEWRDLWAGIA
jgi:hypothetical protein